MYYETLLMLKCWDSIWCKIAVWRIINYFSQHSATIKCLGVYHSHFLHFVFLKLNFKYMFCIKFYFEHGLAFLSQGGNVNFRDILQKHFLKLTTGTWKHQFKGLDERTFTIEGRITVQLVYSFTSLDSTASQHTINNNFLGWSSPILLNWRPVVGTVIYPSTVSDFSSRKLFHLFGLSSAGKLPLPRRGRRVERGIEKTDRRWVSHAVGCGSVAFLFFHMLHCT